MRMSTSQSSASAPVSASEPTRRDFLYIATATVGAIGAAATLVPFVDQMNPDASTLAAGGPVDLDISKIEEGAQVVVRWRQRPIFVFHRSRQTLQTMQSKQMISLLADPDSKELQQPPYATNWHRSIKPEFGILVGICTHLGISRCSIHIQVQQLQYLSGWVAIFVLVTAPNTIPQVVFSTVYQPRITCRYRPIVLSAIPRSELAKIPKAQHGISAPFASCKQLWG
jgi:ubiquinol-cytochrome c reductase iron-sulfur subunit